MTVTKEQIRPPAMPAGRPLGVFGGIGGGVHVGVVGDAAWVFQRADITDGNHAGSIAHRAFLDRTLVQAAVNIPAEAKEFYVDTSHAERIFINLINNAIKFTPKNGTITIAASPALDRGYITFSVADTGIGIAQEDLKKLFNEFYRVENEINQSVKGTGLGLTLAKNIVEAHRGRI